MKLFLINTGNQQICLSGFNPDEIYAYLTENGIEGFIEEILAVL